MCKCVGFYPKLPLDLLITEGLLIDGVILPSVKQVNNWNRPRISKSLPRQIASQKRLSRSLAFLSESRINSPYSKPGRNPLPVLSETSCNWRNVADSVTGQLAVHFSNLIAEEKVSCEGGGGWGDQPVEANSFSRAEAAFLDESEQLPISSRRAFDKSVSDCF